MKKLLLLGLLAIASVNANALTQQCPPAFAYRHLGSSVVWEIANEYLNQGWSISQTPAAQNFSGNPSLSNPLHVVLNNKNDTNTFYMTCKNEVMPGLTVDAVQYNAQADPSNNPNFKKIDSNTFVCNTTINHPELCISNSTPTVSRVMNDLTGGSIN